MPAPLVPHLLFTTMALLALTTRQGQAQDAEPAPVELGSAQPAWTVQVDPLTTTFGIAHILLERRVSDHVAVYAGPSLRLYDSPLTPDDEEGHRAYGAEFGARWFFQGTAPSGWWAGGRAIVARLSFKDEDRIGGYVSALGGYAWIFDGRWVVSAALGLSYFDYKVAGAGTEGVLPGAHTAVGVAF